MSDFVKLIEAAKVAVMEAQQEAPTSDSLKRLEGIYATLDSLWIGAKLKHRDTQSANGISQGKAPGMLESLAMRQRNIS